jgi:hypothetical protein
MTAKTKQERPKSQYKLKNEFDWYFGTCCRYHTHSFRDAANGASCICGLTNLRWKSGGWIAVWNTEGVKLTKVQSKEKLIRRLVEQTAKQFRCFGISAHMDQNNPVSYWLRDIKPQFALGTDLEAVVRFIIEHENE